MLDVLAFLLFLVAVCLFIVRLVSKNLWKDGKPEGDYSGFPGPGVFGKWLLVSFVLWIVVFIPSLTLTFVPAGHVGIADFYGSVTGPYMPGLNFIPPLSSLVVVPTRTTQIQETMDVPSLEGLTVHLDVSLLYHVFPDKAVPIYKSIGADYDSVFIIPQSRSAARGATVRYEAKALYTSSRDMVAGEIYRELADSLLARGFVLERVLLRSIALPEAVSSAINEKMAAEQQAERMKFVLDKERMEAERKRVEASGIRDFQKIVSEGISEPLLEWKGIEATEKIAESPNAKIIIIGSPKNGLPLVLGGQ